MGDKNVRAQIHIEAKATTEAVKLREAAVAWAESVKRPVRDDDDSGSLQLWIDLAEAAAAYTGRSWATAIDMAKKVAARRCRGCGRLHPQTCVAHPSLEGYWHLKCYEKAKLRSR